MSRREAIPSPVQRDRAVVLAAILAGYVMIVLDISIAFSPAGLSWVQYAAAAGIAASVGLVLGGLLADWPSWRAGFLLNLPVGIALLLAARRHLVETGRRPGRCDFAGAVTFTLRMTALVFGLVRAPSCRT